MGMVKNEVSFVRRPAMATYMAPRPAAIPKPPPTLVIMVLPVMSAAARMKKVMTTRAKTATRATEARSKQIVRQRVTRLGYVS